MALSIYDQDPCEKMLENISKNPDLEKGLHKVGDNPNTDPELRNMIAALLTEFENTKNRSEKRQMQYKIALVLALVFGSSVVFILLIIKYAIL